MVSENRIVNMNQTGSYTSAEWKETCAKHRLHHRMCPVDHQAMNGQVERVQGVLASKMRALLMDGNMEGKYWPLALETASYLLNRMPHESLGGLSPIEKSTGEKPDLSRTRTFGCTAYVQIPKAQRKGKLSNIAWKGVLVGYSTQSPEWRILDPRSGNIRNAYSVTFDENKRGLKITENVNSCGNVIITENVNNVENVTSVENELTEPQEEKDREEKPRTWIEKWAEGKFTPTENEEL